MRQILILVLLAIPALLAAEVVELIDGQRLTGRVVKRDDTTVVLKMGRAYAKLPRRLIKGIYENLQEADAARRADPAWQLRQARPTASAELEAAARERVEALLGLAAPADRARLREGLPAEEAALLPEPAVVANWLGEPAHPRCLGRTRSIPLPWLADDKRSSAILGLPADYDAASRPWPLVIALHGTENHPRNIAATMRGVVGAGCILLAPQTTTPRGWWTQHQQIRHIYTCVGHLYRHYRIDPRRIVICGGSGGGMGTWRIAATHPELFCRAGSFSGMPAIKVEEVARLAGVPFYVLHGSRDHIPVAGPRKMVAEMERLGLEHVYVEYDGDHFPSAKLKRGFREWLQVAAPKPGASPRPALLEFATWAVAAERGEANVEGEADEGDGKGVADGGE